VKHHTVTPLAASATRATDLDQVRGGADLRDVATGSSLRSSAYGMA